MLQKIKEFFKGSRPHRSALTLTEEQVDTGTAIIEMLDHARIVDCDVVITISVGNRTEGMIFRGGSGDEIADRLYQMVSVARMFWVDEWKKEQDSHAERLWTRISKKIDEEEEE